MKEYHLTYTNEKWRDFSLAISPLLFLGGIALRFLWQDIMIRTIALAGLCIVFGIIFVCYYKARTQYYTAIADQNKLLIKNKRDKILKRIDIDDIGVIIYVRSSHILSSSMVHSLPKESIFIYSKTGKLFFNYSNQGYRTDYYRLLTDLNEINDSHEQVIYKTHIRGTNLAKTAFINPKHENKLLVRRLLRKNRLYYPIIIFCILNIVFWTLYSLWSFI